MTALSRRGLIQASAATLGAVALPVLASQIPAAEPLVALRKRFVELMALSNRQVDGEAADAAADAALELCVDSVDLRATTPAGALASLEWAREEFARFHVAERNEPDFMDVWTLAMIDSALGVLRQAAAVVI